MILPLHNNNNHNIIKINYNIISHYYNLTFSSQISYTTMHIENFYYGGKVTVYKHYKTENQKPKKAPWQRPSCSRLQATTKQVTCKYYKPFTNSQRPANVFRMCSFLKCSEHKKVDFVTKNPSFPCWCLMRLHHLFRRWTSFGNEKKWRPVGLPFAS